MKTLENPEKNGEEEPKAQEKISKSQGGRIKIQAKKSGRPLFLTTKISNILPIFFNINTNINIKILKNFNINIKINILEMHFSISISKSIFWSCNFQYQNQYQYDQNFDFSKFFKILSHV